MTFRKPKIIVVKRYRGKRKLRRGIERMARDGYGVQTHTTTRHGLQRSVHTVVFVQAQVQEEALV